MIVRQLDSNTSTPRFVCSHRGYLEKEYLFDFEITRIFNIEWVINSEATIALNDQDGKLICFLSGNGRLTDLNVLCKNPYLVGVHETDDTDTMSIIVTVSKCNE